MEQGPFEQDPQVHRNRRAVRITLLAGGVVLWLGFSLALNPGDRAEAGVRSDMTYLSQIEPTSFAPDTRSRAASDYEIARAALGHALGEGDVALRDTATYFTLLETTGRIFLTTERDSAQAAIAALNTASHPRPHAEKHLAYETARLAYLDYLLTKR
jgi:hypothetical protein